MTLYAAASLELLRELTHQPMEGQPADQRLGGLSEPTGLPERNSTRAEVVASKTAAAMANKACSLLVVANRR